MNKKEEARAAFLEAHDLAPKDDEILAILEKCQ